MYNNICILNIISQQAWKSSTIYNIPAHPPKDRSQIYHCKNVLQTHAVGETKKKCTCTSTPEVPRRMSSISTLRIN